MKASSTLTFLIFLLMTLFITEFAFAYPRSSDIQGSRTYTQSNHITHTVQKNESLWAIARQFDVDFARLAEINGLNNPDLIFPGNKLVIKIQDDGSILVGEKLEVPKNIPFNYTPRQVIAHVTHPDPNDVFAPSNPTVTYEVKEAVLEPVQKTFKEPLIFKTFEKFVRWLSSSLGYSSDLTQARGHASFDPPTSPTYLHSEIVTINTSGSNGDQVVPFQDNFSFFITAPTSPPPKSL